MATFDDYRQALDEIEANPDLARMGRDYRGDPAFAVRTIERELRQALWQHWAKAEAAELADRAARLLERLTAT